MFGAMVLKRCAVHPDNETSRRKKKKRKKNYSPKEEGETEERQGRTRKNAAKKTKFPVAGGGAERCCRSKR